MASSLFGANSTAQNQNGMIQRIQQIKSLMSSMQNASNPQQMLNSIISQNPQMRSVQELIDKHNGDARAAFYELAKERGVDPEVIIDALKS